jgi:hypothetical protein
MIDYTNPTTSTESNLRTGQRDYGTQSLDGIKTQRRERRAASTVLGGAVIEGLAGGAAVVLTIIGLAVLSLPLLAVSTIVLGGALLIGGGTIASRFGNLWAPTNEGRRTSAEPGKGITAEFFGGLLGVALGILSLLGLIPLVLLPAAAILYGTVMVVGAASTARLNEFEVWQHADHPEHPRSRARGAVTVASDLQMMIGIGGIALGVLALVSVAPTALTFVAMLALGASILASGSAFSGRMVGFYRR